MTRDQLIERAIRKVINPFDFNYFLYTGFNESEYPETYGRIRKEFMRLHNENAPKSNETSKLFL